MLGKHLIFNNSICNSAYFAKNTTLLTTNNKGNLFTRFCEVLPITARHLTLFLIIFNSNLYLKWGDWRNGQTCAYIDAGSTPGRDAAA